MARIEQRQRISDVHKLRALAHPLRIALLNHLLAMGTQTATECANALDASPSNCSWHLRQLARAGVVERDPDARGHDRRERAWRASATGFDFGSRDPGPDEQLVQTTLLGLVIEREATLAEAYLARQAQYPQAWRDAATLNTYGLLLTASELATLVDDLDARIRPYIAATRTSAPPDARPVAASLRAFLRPERG